MFFSDAVFAMTLLVLDLEVPDGLSEDQVGAALVAAVVDRDLYRSVLRALLPVPLVFAGTVPLAFLVPGVAMYAWLSIIPADVVVHRVINAPVTASSDGFPRAA